MADFGVLVVATQHDTSIRALLHVAHLRGTRTVYVPHAPVANNAWYADLPVMFAALRGDLEVAHYREMGVTTGRMTAVGNPAVDAPVELPELALQRPAVALSPWPSSVVATYLDVVARGCPQAVLAPHPRTDVQSLAARIPSGWATWPGRSFDLLLEGPSVLVQRSSGLAWEALSLGIPVVQVDLDRDPPNYPFLEGRYVLRVDSAEGLSAALDAARSQGADRAHRHELRTYAAGWCAATGSEAAGRCWGVIRAAADDEPSPLLLDGWAA
jgi:hypothetical protein